MVDHPFAIRGRAAAGILLAGMVLGMLSMGTGWLPLGVAALIGMGLAIGLLGSLRQRLGVALLFFAAMLLLTLAGMALGEDGFTLVGPVLLSLLLLAAGHFSGVLAGLLLRWHALE